MIVTTETSREVTTTVVGYGKTLGKTVIVVNDAPASSRIGFSRPTSTRRGSCSMKAWRSRPSIGARGIRLSRRTDHAHRRSGLDIAGKSGAIMLEAFGSRMAPSQSLTRVVAAGRTGRKGRKGFYRYDANGKKRGVDPSVYELLPAGAGRIELPVDEIQRRCVLAMVNEAARCLQEGILRSSRDGDVGAVFGIGFPPFRGGPFRHVDSLGAQRVVRALEGLNRPGPASRRRC